MGINKSKIYVETLIKLVEYNNDSTWLTTFKSLRAGGSLPGGGAGSLNDWGPYYTDKTQSAWYPILYDILRFLFDQNTTPDQIYLFKLIKQKDNIRILRCSKCNNAYQHPAVFERHISLDFYQRNFKNYADQNNLSELLAPENSYQHPLTIDYRNWLMMQYDDRGIKIYDFVSNKYICPHCTAEHVPTEEDLYIVNYNSLGIKNFYRQLQNATWTDFENTSW